MLVRLPVTVDPLHLADKRGALKGQIPLADLERLADILFNDTGAVDVELFFGRSGRLATIEGTIHADLQLKCQNCLQPVEWLVDSTVKLGIVTSIEQADRLPEEYEPLLVNEENIPLKDIIEDELLLCLPYFPKHQHNCFTPRPDNDSTPSLANEPQPPASENPFSILANLKIRENINGSTKK